MPQVILTYFTFILWMCCMQISSAQPNSLEIDTIVTSAVESDHFKIRLPKVANIESYKILFSNYGVFSEFDIEGNAQQFLGDYNNIQRTKAINHKIKKQGIEPTLITYFMQPSIEISMATVSQEAITGELTNKSLSFSRKVLDSYEDREKESDIKDQKVQTPQIDEPVEENLTVKTKTPNAENVLEDEKSVNQNLTKKPVKVTSKPFINRPGVKNKPKVADKNIETTQENDIKSDTIARATNAQEVSFLDETLSKKLPETGEYVLLLPLVNNPQVYQIVLKDLGHVKYGELADGSLYFYFGFFDTEEAAKSFKPKLNERGFAKAMPIVKIDKVKQEAQSIYDKDKTLLENELTDKKKVPASKEVDTAGEYFRIELPKVNNPEIFFKAFEDIGNTHSEIAPNGEAVYYIGAFDNPEAALNQLEDLKPRGLSNGSIIRFSADQRINPYRKDQIEPKEALTKLPEEDLPEKNEPLIKTNPKGKYLIKLGQVDNPEVFKEVFGDIGKIKVDYLEDETEYFYLGKYYVKEDAEFVVKQLKERGLTIMELVNAQPGDEPVLTQKLADKTSNSPRQAEEQENRTVEKPKNDIIVNSTEVKPDKTVQTNNPNPGDQPVQMQYKILLGSLENPKLYTNILKDFGSITQAVKEGSTLYYLGNFSTLSVAKLVIKEIRALGIETPLKVVEFEP